MALFELPRKAAERVHGLVDGLGTNLQRAGAVGKVVLMSLGRTPPMISITPCAPSGTNLLTAGQVALMSLGRTPPVISSITPCLRLGLVLDLLGAAMPGVGTSWLRVSNSLANSAAAAASWPVTGLLESTACVRRML